MHRLIISLMLGLSCFSLSRHTRADEPLSATERKAQIARRDRDWRGALLLARQGKLKEAIGFGEGVLNIERDLFGEWDQEIDGTLEWLSKRCIEIRDLKRARSFADTRRQLLIKLHGPDHWSAGDAKRALAHLARLEAMPADDLKKLIETDRKSQQLSLMIRTGRARQAIAVAQQIRDVRAELLGQKSLEFAQSLNDLGMLYFRTGDLKRSAAMHEQVIDLKRTITGETHPSFATSLTNLAAVHKRQSQFDDAERLFDRAREIRLQTLGKNHPDYAVALSNLAGLYVDTGRLQIAQPLYRKAVEIQKRASGPTSAAYSQALNNLAFLQRSLGRFASAQELYAEAVEIMRKAVGTNDPRYALVLNNLAVAKQLRGDSQSALADYRTVSKIFARVPGRAHPLFAVNLQNQANVHLDLGDLKSASPLLEQAAATLKASPARKEYLICLGSLGAYHTAVGDFSRAEILLRESLEGLRRESSGQSVEYTMALQRLGSFCISTGRLEEAESLLRRAAEIRARVLGEQHILYGESLLNLARLYRQLGDHRRAGPLYEKAVAVRESVFGRDSPQTAIALNNQAVLELDRDDAEKALELLLRVRAIDRAGPEHPQHATTLNNLGVVYGRLGRLQEAEKAQRESLRIREKHLHADHPELARTQHNLGAALLRRGQLSDAEPLILRSVEALRESVLDRHDDYAAALTTLAVLRRQQGRLDESAREFQRALTLTRRVQSDHAVFLSERQQLATSRQRRHRLDRFLSLAVEHKPAQAAAIAELLQWKGATLERQRQMRRLASDPKVSQQFAELQVVSAQLSTLIATGPTGDVDSWKKAVSDLTAEREDLESKISRTSGAAGQRGNVTLDQIRQSLPKGTVLLDYFTYSRSKVDPEQQRFTSTRSLLVAVIPQEGESRLMDLGPLAPIVSAIDGWRTSFGASPKSQQAGAVLRHRLWKPVLKIVARHETVLISADGELGRLPFVALPGKKSKSYLIEDHRVAYVPMARLLPEIMERPRATKLFDGMLLVGDVDYGRNDAGRSLPWRPLPGTAGEVDALSQIHGSADDNSLIVLRGSGATETAVREHLTESRLVHIATHGLFRSQRLVLEWSPVISTRGASIEPPASEIHASGFKAERLNSVALSGLVFSGVNQSARRPGRFEDGVTQDDGRLLAQEIAAIPLRNTHLVVLSACDTGQGAVHAGEGLLGLQRAFQIAGARTTVASLWKVDDRATQQLMEKFHRNLARDKVSFLDALRNAQLELLRAGRRGLSGADEAKTESAQIQSDRLPPFYWGAFVLSGDWR